MPKSIRTWLKEKRKCDEKTLPSIKERGFIDQIFSTNSSDVGSVSNFDHKLSIKYGTNVQAVQGIITEYCNDSTVHGFKYIGDHRRPGIERIVWTCALIISISICCYFIKTEWEKRNSSPVIITFDEKLTHVWEIPFPTVTICPEMKTNPNVFNFTGVILRNILFNHTLTQEENYFVNVVGQMCQKYMIPGYTNKSEKTSNISDLMEAMSRVSPAFEDIIIKTKWRETDFQLERECFHKVLTENGPCYSFNSLDAKTIYREEALVEGTSFNDDNDKTSQWNLDNGFNIATDKTHPLHASGPGSKEGLLVTLTGYPKNSDILCQGSAQGFKLIISTPGDIPQVSKQFLSIPFDQKVTVSIKPEIVYTSQGLHYLDPEKRKCYFQNERYLKYFKAYTQSNCELECHSNITLEYCECVKFHMPRTESVPVCGLRKIKCLKDMKRLLVLQKLTQLQKESCNCLPTCNTMNYRAEIEDISTLERFSLWPYFNISHNNSFTQLSISFRENDFYALRRSERHTFIEFIASCGGLLGLFMGVSMLSLVELLSFLTIRLWINLRMRRKKRLEMKNIQVTNPAPNNNKLTV